MYLLIILVITSLSLVSTVFVANVYFRQPPVRMPNWFRRIVFDCLAYVVMYHEDVVKLCDESKVDHPMDDKDEPQVTHGMMKSPNDTDTEMLFVQKQILQELRSITQKSMQTVNPPDQADSDMITKELQLIATILDRFFFCMYFTAVVVVNVIILGIRPYV